MYKITITNKYNLFKFNSTTQTNSLLGKFDKVETLKAFVKEFMPGKIVLEEIDVAIKWMSDTKHNTAEFGGMRGLFTVSYFDEKEV